MAAKGSPAAGTLTAREVKDRLLGRHPSIGVNGGPGEWTCLEEPFGIDLLAISAWGSSKFARIGYEIKISRSDYRRELLKPSKRVVARALCNQFYMAVPAGLLKPEEIAWEESLWDDGDFQRKPCPAKCRRGPHRDGRRYLPRQGTVSTQKVPVPIVVDIDSEHAWWNQVGYAPEQRELNLQHAIESHLRHYGCTYRQCPTCEGRGYVRGSRVEREAPTLWIPRDVGLVEIHGGGCRVVREAPKTVARELTIREIATLVRWASFRPDRRHRPAAPTQIIAA